MYDFLTSLSNGYSNRYVLFSVAGKVKVVEVLVKYGADVNSVSDTGSTPVRSACFMTHLDVVRLLVANNADIQKPNHNGGTCLINSVQSVELCKFLLENGAAVNAEDIQNKTGNYQMTIDTTKLKYRYLLFSSLSNTYFFSYILTCFIFSPSLRNTRTPT